MTQPLSLGIKTTIDKLIFYDLSGKIGLETDGAPTAAQIQKLAAGHYLMKAILADGTTATKLVIKR